MYERKHVKCYCTVLSFFFFRREIERYVRCVQNPILCINFHLAINFLVRTNENPYFSILYSLFFFDMYAYTQTLQHGLVRLIWVMSVVILLAMRTFMPLYGKKKIVMRASCYKSEPIFVIFFLHHLLLSSFRVSLSTHFAIK